MIAFASFVARHRLLAWCGVQSKQYVLLVGLFASLGARKELVGHLGLDRGALGMASLMLLLPGVGLALVAFAPISLGTYELLLLSASSAILLVILLPEAANSFLNPAEASVLAHRPIAAPTYLAAKLTYLLVVVLRAQLSLNGPAAIAGLFRSDVRWFYPLTHLSAAMVTGVFLALVACAIFGVMMRVVPLARLRTVALWLQFVVALAPLLVNALQRPVVAAAGAVGPRLRGIDWSFLPFTWFAALGIAGQASGRPPMSWASVAAGAAASLVFIVFGVRALSSGYMTRVVAITKSMRGTSRPVRWSFLGAVVGRLSGSPAGRASYDFVTRMMRRDWQFRRSSAQFGVLLVIAAPALWRGMRSSSPFVETVPSAFSILPEILGFGTLLICTVIGFSDHYRAAWVFNPLPPGVLARYIRGVFWSVWLLFAALPILAAVSAVALRWGAVDALLFGSFSLAVSALLLAMQIFFMEGLPFTEAPKSQRIYLLLPVVLFGPVVLGVAWFVQARLLFQSRPATGLVAALLAAATVAVARATMAVVAARARAELGRRPLGAPVMLKATDDS